MIDGILLIDKEEEITSYDVIRRLKKILEKEQKIGHAGTLDPFASGLLIVLLGKATKLMETFHTYEKVYEVEAEFGFATDTQDISGNVIERDKENIKPSINEIREHIEESFLGEISQIPPEFSAKRVNGRRAYDLAREGENFELESKEIFVSQFEIYEYHFPNVKFKIKCSTGTYIRTLINDLGKKLGTYATAKNLRRISVGSFNVKEAISSKDKLERENILRRVINV